MKNFITVALVIGCFIISGCVSTTDKASDSGLTVRLVEVTARSQVDEREIRTMTPQKIWGNNGEYLEFRVFVVGKDGFPAIGIPVLWETKGDNNRVVQETDAQGGVVFWEPVGEVPNSLPTRKSKWGPMLENMTVKARIGLVGEAKTEISVKLYK